MSAIEEKFSGVYSLVLAIKDLDRVGLSSCGFSHWKRRHFSSHGFDTYPHFFFFLWLKLPASFSSSDDAAFLTFSRVLKDLCSEALNQSLFGSFSPIGLARLFQLVAQSHVPFFQCTLLPQFFFLFCCSIRSIAEELSVEKKKNSKDLLELRFFRSGRFCELLGGKKFEAIKRLRNGERKKARRYKKL